MAMYHLRKQLSQFIKMQVRRPITAQAPPQSTQQLQNGCPQQLQNGCPQQLQKDGKILCKWCGKENSADSVLMDSMGNGKLVSPELCRVIHKA
jgi:hypothetical protein